MQHRQEERVITSRVIRAPDVEPRTNEWVNYSAAERIEAVWTLTLSCLNWNTENFRVPRLQRTVTRIQRTEG